MSEIEQNGTPKKRPRWTKGFLAALAQTGNIRQSCEVAGVGRTTVYTLRDEDMSFANEWEQALDESADLLEQEARRRAEQGVRRLKFHNGQLITLPAVDADGAPLLDKDNRPIMVPYVEHEYSDTLMIFLLKGIRPEKYRERQQVEHTGKGGGPIEIDNARSELATILSRTLAGRNATGAAGSDTSAPDADSGSTP